MRWERIHLTQLPSPSSRRDRQQAALSAGSCYPLPSFRCVLGELHTGMISLPFFTGTCTLAGESTPPGKARALLTRAQQINTQHPPTAAPQDMGHPCWHHTQPSGACRMSLLLIQHGNRKREAPFPETSAQWPSVTMGIPTAFPSLQILGRLSCSVPLLT